MIGYSILSYAHTTPAYLHPPSYIISLQASRRVLVYVWDTCLRLLHPFMPFLTEALWQLIPHTGDSIMIADWPQLEDSAPLPLDPNAGALSFPYLSLCLCL
jgi:hypothetical protein